jgi:nitrogen regulatory protein PII
MKKIEATIRALDLDTAKHAAASAGVRTLLASDAVCVGESFNERRVYRGSTYVVEGAVCVRLEAAVADEDVEGVVDALAPFAERSPSNDGAIIVTNVEQVFYRRGTTTPHGLRQAVPATNSASSLSRSETASSAPLAHFRGEPSPA